MKRDDALEAVQLPALSQLEVNELYDFVAKKLRISLKELQSYETMELKSFSDYKNQSTLYSIASMVFKIFKGDISGAKR
jgi:parvulin-like peptidyl-prolyl isomerase